MTQISGAELVTRIFGHWPSFHDAEVVRIVLERTGKNEASPLLLADVHTFEMTSDTDQQGFYVRRNHILVRFRFEGLQDLELNDFNTQNALSTLTINEIDSPTLAEPLYEIGFDGVHGVSATFSCRKVMVAGVEPWDVETRPVHATPVIDVAAVKAQIVEAFSRGMYPGDWCLINSREGSEPGLLEEEFKGKTDWQALDPTFIDQAPDGFGTALHFFSDEAFRFYLPAYLLADLDGKLRQANCVFALTYGLDDESREKKINPQRYGERTWFEHARHKFAIFNAEEVEAIVSYLRYQLSSDALTDYEKGHIKDALNSYWASRRVLDSSRTPS